MDSIAGERLDGDGVDAEAEEPGYADVSRLPLREIIAADDTALGHSLRRLLAEMERSEEPFAGFSSYPRSPW